MNPRQRQEFVNALTRNRIQFLESGDEIGILCPKCSHLHDKQRLTLSINTGSDKWHCWRCEELSGEDRMRGRKEQIPKLLRALRMESLLPIFDADDVMIEDDSLEKLKHRLLFGEEKPVEAKQKVELPKGYSTEWSGIIGKSVYRYLREKRGLSKETIKKYRIGYTAVGRHAGCAILPVYQKGKLVFWQTRQVCFHGKLKYDSPKVERNNILFDYESVDPKNVIIVEGIFDKLSVGGSCVGLLGKTISSEQIGMLAAKAVRSVTVMLDGEAWKDSQRIAERIAANLWTARRVNAVRLPYGKDPGNLGRIALLRPLEIRRFNP